MIYQEKQNEYQVPVKRGCSSADSGWGCMCMGHCQDIVGYRDMTPDERQKYDQENNFKNTELK